VTDAPVRVAVNLLWLATGRVGGSEQYLTRQLAGLPDDPHIEPRIEPHLYVQPTFAAAHPELASRFATTPMPVRRDWRPLRIGVEHTWLHAKARTADMVHHGGGTVPFTGSHPVLLTVHDLQYREFPHYFSRARLTYLSRMMPRSVGRATVVATPSEYVRGTVIDAFGTDPDRIVVVPHGVPAHHVPDHATCREVAARYGISDRPYVVYPAITHPHKGHRLLVEMLAELDTDHLLVLVGGEGAAEPEIRRAVAATGTERRVIRTGRVPDADRDALVAGARALVFASEYEGFGAPLVEAMMLGTPVVCSDHPAIREVVADAGVVVTERSGAAWAAAVRAAERDRDRLIGAGVARADAFTVGRSGEALAAAYRRVAAIAGAG
jgi:glycosyltransferase involved in cell wall biosynthesis